EPHNYVIQRRLITLKPGPPVQLQIQVQSPDPRWREVMLQAELLPRVPPSLPGSVDETRVYGEAAAPGAR
ncbi:MAG: hypothetical protein VYE15_00090, partial [Myxococcota bacterium]|nr:hypothetical protein [Myxococcota bacterium]